MRKPAKTKYDAIPVEKREAVVKDYQDFCTYNELAEKYDLTRSLVEGIIERSGVKKRGLHLKRLTPDKQLELIELYKNGESAENLKEKFGISDYVMREIVRENGVKIRPKGGPSYRMKDVNLAKECIEMWKNGYTQTQIGAIKNLNQRTVSKLIKTYIDKDEYVKLSGRNLRFSEGRIKQSDGYMAVSIDKDNPYFCMSYSGGYVLEHRYVMAKHIGRPLERKETVHHLNGDRSDNRIENLQLMSGGHPKGQKFVCCDCGSHNVKSVEI